MRCISCTPSPAPPNGEYLPKPVGPLWRVDEGIFDRGNLFLAPEARTASCPGTIKQTLVQWAAPSGCCQRTPNREGGFVGLVQRLNK
jgi:hypothetical protein